MPQGGQQGPGPSHSYEIGDRSQLPAELRDAFVENSLEPDVLLGVVELGCLATSWDFRPNREKTFYEELLQNISPELMTDEDRARVLDVARRCFEKRDRGVVEVDGIQIDLLGVWRDVVEAVAAEIDDPALPRGTEEAEVAERPRGDWVACIFDGAVLDDVWNSWSPGDGEMVGRFRSRLTDRVEDERLAHRLVEETVARLRGNRA